LKKLITKTEGNKAAYSSDIIGEANHKDGDYYILSEEEPTIVELLIEIRDLLKK